MVKIVFGTIILFLSASLAKAAQITLKESFLSDYVAQKENVKPEDVRQIVLKKDKLFKDGVILLNSSTNCGMGLCSYYTFVKNSFGSFEFAGTIQGVFQSTNQIQNSKLPEIITQTKSGTEQSLTTKWRFNQASKVYEAQ